MSGKMLVKKNMKKSDLIFEKCLTDKLLTQKNITFCLGTNVLNTIIIFIIKRIIIILIVKVNINRGCKKNCQRFDHIQSDISYQSNHD